MTFTDLRDGELTDVIVHSLEVGFGTGEVGLGVIAAGVLLALWISTESTTMVATVAVLGGGAIFGFMPPEIRRVGALLILAGVVLVGSRLYFEDTRI